MKLKSNFYLYFKTEGVHSTI